MQHFTRIITRQGKTLLFDRHIPIKVAVILARDHGLDERLEIQHFLKEQHEEIVYTSYYINEKNKIVCEIHPILFSS